jgi:hypothetical protein
VSACLLYQSIGKKDRGERKALSQLNGETTTVSLAPMSKTQEQIEQFQRPSWVLSKMYRTS